MIVVATSNIPMLLLSGKTQKVSILVSEKSLITAVGWLSGYKDKVGSTAEVCGCTHTHMQGKCWRRRRTLDGAHLWTGMQRPAPAEAEGQSRCGRVWVSCTLLYLPKWADRFHLAKTTSGGGGKPRWGWGFTPSWGHLLSNYNYSDT